MIHIALKNSKTRRVKQITNEITYGNCVTSGYVVRCYYQQNYSVQKLGKPLWRISLSLDKHRVT